MFHSSLTDRIAQTAFPGTSCTLLVNDLAHFRGPLSFCWVTVSLGREDLDGLILSEIGKLEQPFRVLRQTGDVEIGWLPELSIVAFAPVRS